MQISNFHIQYRIINLIIVSGQHYTEVQWYDPILGEVKLKKHQMVHVKNILPLNRIAFTARILNEACLHCADKAVNPIQ